MTNDSDGNTRDLGLNHACRKDRPPLSRYASRRNAAKFTSGSKFIV